MLCECSDVVDDPNYQDALLVTDADQEAVVHHPVAGQEGGVPLDRLVQRVLVRLGDVERLLARDASPPLKSKLRLIFLL